MSAQSTLLTCSKGVDLHAATAYTVMRSRLEGGGRLQALRRCELHTFWGEPAGLSLSRLLTEGRYYNPNKHHFGNFRWTGPGGAPWFSGTGSGGQELPEGWPGDVLDSDLDLSGPVDLYTRLLGGTPEPALQVVDVAAFDLGQEGPVLSGVLWRLILDCAPAEAAELGGLLAVTRSRKEGLLINPHMTDWLLRVQRPGQEAQ